MTNLLCSWCKIPIPRGIFCGRKHRQAAWRVRKRLRIEEENKSPIRCAYADPPYPNMAAKLYKDQPSYAGEVDLKKLVPSLEASYDGFALSTSAKALSDVLPLFTRPYRICVWVKPIGVSVRTFGIHNAWEPLIVVPGRQLRPGKRDWLSAQPARNGDSDLIGRKPEAFCCWLFELLGMLPGDELDDLFPGSGIVGRAWEAICRQSATAS